MKSRNTVYQPELGGNPRRYYGVYIGHMIRSVVTLLAIVASACGDRQPYNTTRIGFTCGDGRRLQVTFVGTGQDATVETSSARYLLDRTKKRDSRKFVSDDGHVILRLDDARSATLTQWDLVYQGCQGKLPNWLIERKELPVQ